jgi:hypothetical protein
MMVGAQGDRTLDLSRVRAGAFHIMVLKSLTFMILKSRVGRIGVTQVRDIVFMFSMGLRASPEVFTAITTHTTQRGPSAISTVGP